jgi:hypothetical protein
MATIGIRFTRNNGRRAIMQMPLRGGCQCGAVRFEIGTPPLCVYACHCTECQRQSGSAFALSMPVARDSITVVKGTPKAWRRVHESGRVAACMYCADCGTRLFHNPERNPAVSIVKPGTLDDTRWLVPVGHIWTRSAQPWFRIPDDGVNYEAQPPDLTRLNEAWRARRA